MKKAISISIILLIALAAGVSPAFAFDLPGQSSDNATDVVLWYGDNLTMESGNLTLTIVDLEDALTAAAEAQAATITDNQTTISNQYLALLIVALIIALVFWQRTLFLYMLAVPVCMVYGLSLAANSDNGSSLWVSGIIVAVIGTYCLFKAVMLGLEDYRARRK